MTDYIDMVARWADWAQTVIESWSANPKGPEPVFSWWRRPR